MLTKGVLIIALVVLIAAVMYAGAEYFAQLPDKRLQHFKDDAKFIVDLWKEIPNPTKPSNSEVATQRPAETPENEMPSACSCLKSMEKVSAVEVVCGAGPRCTSGERAWCEHALGKDWSCGQRGRPVCLPAR